ncbi:MULTISPECIES: quinone oxidoreductase family protein [Streptomyces]|uniref:Zinc-binding dehydrogenase n=1 Tax=Streptomyces bangladeshensis TaxID=295352 RepID=A0ABN3BV71_9ACTN|nr:zinc-binding dehydrogenase [Streptomyces sp. SID7810]CUW30365.1 Mycocerosic acid synthase [Streptomyces reticuli]
MRAVVVKAPGPVEALEFAEVPEPSPGAGELTIDVAYAGVGFVDTLFRSGAFDVPTPFTPGIEVTGHVREVGPGVAGFVPGQPVAALLNDFGRGMRAGGYAEVAVAHSAMAVGLPDDTDLAHVAAALVNGVTAWMALHDLARIGVHDNVLVLGASGGLGSVAGRIAAVHPARTVTGVFGRTPDGPSATDPWTRTLGTDGLDGIAPGEVDVVVDPVGGELSRRAYQLLAPFGRLVVLGNASGQEHPVTTDSAWLGTRQLLGLSLGGVAHLVPDRVTAALSAVVALVRRDVLREPAPAVLPLDRVADVHRALEQREAPAKTVLAVR